MNVRELDMAELSYLWTTGLAVLILGGFSAMLLAVRPWGFDVLFSGLTHFFALFPLTLLVILTYVAKSKLDESEREVPR